MIEESPVPVQRIPVPGSRESLEDLEIQLFLEALFVRYGYDFREHARTSLKRRIHSFLGAEKLFSISGLQERVLHDPACVQRLILALSVNVTSMYRDPEFFLAIRERLFPLFRTYPFVRIWHAGCSSGEEVYSLAILLEEAELYDRCRIYATDLNEMMLHRAREGIFPVEAMEQYERAYRKAGGAKRLADYYTSGYGSAILRSSLRRNIVFSPHNLATDGSFNEFHAIFCRNVMIYFGKSLQDRVHNLLYDSLGLCGALGLGSKETVRFTPHERDYQQVEQGIKLYRRSA